MFAGMPSAPEDELPTLDECVQHIRSADKPDAASVLKAARARGTPIVQPRCGVGSQQRMIDLLLFLEREARPEILSVTIDSHTRLLHFDQAARTLAEDQARLNGYPLVAHGWRRGRLLDAAVRAPLEVRHGSPDGRRLFQVAVASGLTSFEGGGLSYNLPYAKDVPVSASLAAWQDIDRACGELARNGVVVERELFGSLTGVLVPPAISLAVSVLEGVAAAAEGVRCLSVAYPQCGNAIQDVAALQAIPLLAQRYLGPGVDVYPVLHQFMGVFPRSWPHAVALILSGGLIARWGDAAKVIVKTPQEADGIPDAEANAQALNLTRVAASDYLTGFGADEAAVADERDWILREVAELVEPILAEPRLQAAIDGAVRSGRLDIPFSASIHAHSAVIPRRDPSGAIRIAVPGRLPLSETTRRRNERLLGTGAAGAQEAAVSGRDLIAAISADLEFFSEDGRR